MQNALQFAAPAGRAKGDPFDSGKNMVFFKPSETMIVEMAPRRVVRCAF